MLPLSIADVYGMSLLTNPNQDGLNKEDEEVLPDEHQPSAGLARSASLLSIGNMASRLLGLVRDMVIASFFGASGTLSAFIVARQVPLLVYDFLVGGILSAALVPTLSEYAQPERRSEFVRLAGTLLSIFTIVLGLFLLLLELATPTIASLLQSDPALLPTTTKLMYLTMISVWLSGMAGVFMAILYAQQRFTFPAIATAVYNLGIIVAAPLLAKRIGVTSLAVGLLLGSTAQLLLMGFDLRRWQNESRQNETGQSQNVQERFRFRLDWQHPALRKILRLYMPIAAGMLLSIFQVGVDRRLATSTGPSSVSWMQFATTLQQMPLGLISVAIALAALPKLSQYFSANDEDAYRATLVRGLRMVMLLIVPAAIVLWFLGTPVTRLLFQRGEFTALDTTNVVAALAIYVIGMLFAAIDYPLNYAMYARGNTLIPALVGIVSVVIYLLIAFALLTPLGYLGLVWADSAKHASHALIMLGVLQNQVGGMMAELWRVAQTIVPAAVGMMLAIITLQWTLGAHFAQTIGGDLLQIVAFGGSGLLIYIAVLAIFKAEELEILGNGLQRFRR